VKKIDKDHKTNKKEEKVDTKKLKKEFNIEIVKVGKLEERTAGLPQCKSECYGCDVSQ
jgi:hypothetical protein